MKTMLVIILVLVSCTSWSKTPDAYLLNLPQNTVGKVEAARAILFKKSGSVYRCQEVELSDKLTLVAKKK